MFKYLTLYFEHKDSHECWNVSYKILD